MLNNNFTRRPWQVLLSHSRRRWRRLTFIVLCLWAYSVYYTEKQPFNHLAHAITNDDIIFEQTVQDTNRDLVKEKPALFPALDKPESVLRDHGLELNYNNMLDMVAARRFCHQHSWFPWSTRYSGKRKIYDLIMLNGELDWLEIRMETMHQHVNYFVIMESPITFTGLERELVFEKNKDRFEKYKGKIIYRTLKDPPKDAPRPWDVEDYQRNALLLQGLNDLHFDETPADGDVLIVADVDELVRPAALMLLRECDFPARVTLSSQFYYYGFQNKHVGPQWPHPQATIYRTNNTILPTDLRNGEGGSKLLSWWQKADVPNAGWHCSTCFQTIGDVLDKMKSFSHVPLNDEQYRDRTRIVDRVRKGLDLWDRPGQTYEKIEGNEDIPAFLKGEEGKQRFGYLLNRDGPDAGFTDYGESGGE